MALPLFPVTVRPTTGGDGELQRLSATEAQELVEALFAWLPQHVLFGRAGGDPETFAIPAGSLFGRKIDGSMGGYSASELSQLLNLSGLLATKANLVHSHDISQVVGLVAALADKAAAVHSHAFQQGISDIDWTTLGADRVLCYDGTGFLWEPKGTGGGTGNPLGSDLDIGTWSIVSGGKELLSWDGTDLLLGGAPVFPTQIVDPAAGHVGIYDSQIAKFVNRRLRGPDIDIDVAGITASDLAGALAELQQAIAAGGGGGTGGVSNPLSANLEIGDFGLVQGNASLLRRVDGQLEVGGVPLPLFQPGVTEVGYTWQWVGTRWAPRLSSANVVSQDHETVTLGSTVQSAISSLLSIVQGKADSVHSHSISDVTNLATILSDIQDAIDALEQGGTGSGGLGNPITEDLDLANFAIVSGGTELLRVSGGKVILAGAELFESEIVNPAAKDVAVYDAGTGKFKNRRLTSADILAMEAGEPGGAEGTSSLDQQIAGMQSAVTAATATAVSAQADAAAALAAGGGGVVPTNVRRGAVFGDTSGVASLGYAPSTSAGLTIEFRVVINGDKSGVVYGRQVAGYAGVQLIADGKIRLRNGISTLAETTATAPVGIPTKIRVEVGQTSTPVYVDEVLVETLTYSSVAWATSVQSHTLGGQAAGVAMFSGQVWDVRLIDPASAANTAYFSLDGPETGFTNSHPGSNVGDATVAGEIEFALVVGDSGNPVLDANPVAEAASAAAAAAQTAADAAQSTADQAQTDANSASTEATAASTAAAAAQSTADTAQASADDAQADATAASTAAASASTAAAAAQTTADAAQTDATAALDAIASGSQSAGAATVGPPKQVFTFAGQSQNVGAAHVGIALDPNYQTLPDEYGLDVPAGGVYEVSRGSTDTPRYSPAAGKRRALETWAANSTNANSLTPSLPFGKRYKELNPGLEEVVIVNRAVGATGFFDNDWNDGDPEFTAALDETRTFMDEHPEHEWMGMVFAAGENDANDRQSKAFYKSSVLAMWAAFKAGMGPHASNAVLVLTTMSPAWRNIETTSGGQPVTPAHKDEIHQGTIELGDENDDIVTVLLDDVTELETVDPIHWGNSNVRAAYREVALRTTEFLAGLSRTTEFPEYRFRFNGTEFVNTTGDGGLIHDQRIVEDPVYGGVLTTEDSPGSGTYSGYETEIKVDQRHYTISMEIAPSVVPATNIVTFAMGGQNNGTLRWMGYGGARHGDYGSTVSNWVGQLVQDQWDVVTTTYDGTQFRSYLNGVERPNSPQTTNAAVMSGVGDVKLFYFPGTSGTFAGRMRRLDVLPYALSPAAVAALASD